MDQQTSATTHPATPTAQHDAAPAGQPAAANAPAAAAVTPAGGGAPADAGGAAVNAETPTEQAGFGSRGRLRRRARFLRKARELAYRDLGGLVYSLHRFGQRNDALVLAKLETLRRIDTELRALEDSLAERQPVTVLREAGITACPRCAAIHSSEDRFCPGCGLSMSRRSDLPIAGAAAPAPAPQSQAPAPALAAPAPAAAPGPPATPAPAGATPPAVLTPATQAFDAVRSDPQPPGPGRSPAPAAAAQQAPGEEDQPTEIIRPPAPGS
ncbi:MAG TPA: hypothetical protein VL988_00330 [Solirubrobacteraceae bacterium]|nr:hypothetical protein [Solirubrobacteraceae bacterium]